MLRSLSILALGVSLLFGAGISSDNAIQGQVSNPKSEAKSNTDDVRIKQLNNSRQSIYTSTNKQTVQLEKKQKNVSFMDLVRNKNKVGKSHISKKHNEVTNTERSDQISKPSSKEFQSAIETLTSEEKVSGASLNHNGILPSRYTADGKDAVRIEKKTASSFKNSINIINAAKRNAAVESKRNKLKSLMNLEERKTHVKGQRSFGPSDPVRGSSFNNSQSFEAPEVSHPVEGFVAENSDRSGDMVDIGDLVLPDNLEEVSVLIFHDNTNFDIEMEELLYEAGFGYVELYGSTGQSFDDPDLLFEFDLVILPNGQSYNEEMPEEGQQALLGFVESGGGLIILEWAAFNVGLSLYQTLAEVIPMTRNGGGQGLDSAYVQSDHPITQNVDEFFTTDHGYNIGYANWGEVLVTRSSINSTGYYNTGDAVVAADYGDGKVVQFASAGNYAGYSPFQTSENMAQLMINSAAWAAGAAVENDDEPQIGDYYNGGYLFHIGDDGTGLVLSPEEIGFNEWGCYEIDVEGADSWEVGDGIQNTYDILAAECETVNSEFHAALAATDYSYEGYGGWHLPSANELSLAIQHLGNQVEFYGSWYWTSSERDANNSWVVLGTDHSTISWTAKTDQLRAYAVRTVELGDDQDEIMDFTGVADFGNSLYGVSDEPVTFEEALFHVNMLNNLYEYYGYADTFHAQLATIHSQEENDAIWNGLMDSANWIETAMIGFTDLDEEGNWQWVTGEEVTYTNWDGEEPQGGDYENIAKMHVHHGSEGRWHDHHENDQHYFLVEVVMLIGTSEDDFYYLGDYEGNEYYLSSFADTWVNANDFANSFEDDEVHLMTIGSYEEDQFIAERLLDSAWTEDGMQDAWIGFTDMYEEGNWQWVTGEDQDYQNWHQDEPNNYNGEEHHALLERGFLINNGFDSGYWNDANGNGLLRPYIVEVEGSVDEEEVGYATAFLYNEQGDNYVGPATFTFQSHDYAISVESDSGMVSGIELPVGSYSVFGDVIGGPYSLYPALWDVGVQELEADGELHAHLYLYPQDEYRMLFVHVGVDDEGDWNGIPRAEVMIENENYEEIYHGFTNIHGDAGAGLLPGEEYHVTAWIDGNLVGEEDIFIEGPNGFSQIHFDVNSFDDNWLEGYTILHMGNDKAYIVTNDVVDWATAEERVYEVQMLFNQDGQDVGVHLATIHSQEENDLIKYGLLDSLGADLGMIGFTDMYEEGNWQWVTGEEVAYVNWHPGEPGGGDENIAVLHAYTEDGSWHDHGQYQQFHAVIELTNNDEDHDDYFVEGLVMNFDQEPVSGKEVMLYDGEEMIASATSQEDGHYFMHVEHYTDDYDLYTWSDEYWWYHQRLRSDDLDGGAIHDIHLGRQVETANIEVFVFDEETGESLDNMMVHFDHPGDAMQHPERITDFFGVTTYTLQPTEMCIVHVWDMDDEYQSQSDTLYGINANQAIHIEFSMPIDGDDGYDFTFLGEYEGSQYFISDFEMTWTEANELLDQFSDDEMYAHLATIGSRPENDFIVQNGGFGFIGFTDMYEEGNWQWVTGEEITYTNWASEEPNNGGGEEHFAELYGDGLWNDVSNGPMSFIVEVESDGHGGDEYGFASGYIYTQNDGLYQGPANFVFFNLDTLVEVYTENGMVEDIQLPVGGYSAWANAINDDNYVHPSLWQEGVVELGPGQHMSVDLTLFNSNSLAHLVTRVEHYNEDDDMYHSIPNAEVWVVNIAGDTIHFGRTNWWGDMGAPVYPGYEYMVMTRANNEDYEEYVFIEDIGHYGVTLIIEPSDEDDFLEGYTLLYDSDNKAYIATNDVVDWATAEERVYEIQMLFNEWDEEDGVDVHLATIHSQEENDLIKYGLLDSLGTDHGMIGFTDMYEEGNWQWVTGEEVTYTNWDGNEPQGGDYENIAILHAYTENGGWHDHHQYDQFHAVIELTARGEDHCEDGEAVIVGIDDIPNDQGGRVYITFERSPCDTDGMDRTEMYTVERWDDEQWVGLNSVGAYASDEYVVEATTLADSTSEDEAWTTYRIIAHMDEGNFESEAASGYSVDNIAPGMLNGLAANVSDGIVMLSWNQSDANDISHYVVYQGQDPDFIPGDDTMLGMNTVPYFEHNVEELGEYYYVVSAVDVNENEGDYSDVVNVALLSLVDVHGLPEIFTLHQNYPNPFNPSTTIRYDLPEDSNVSLVIYDMMGREVTTLVNGQGSAGYHSIQWDGKNHLGSPVAAGVYIYTIQAGEFRDLNKMIFLK